MKGNTDNSGPHTRSLSEAEREALFKRLHLAHMRRIYQEVAVQAEKEGWSYADFLTLLLAEEVATVGNSSWRTARGAKSRVWDFRTTTVESSEARSCPAPRCSRRLWSPVLRASMTSRSLPFPRH